jgi:predicted component of type VI protein secretion system
VTTPSSPTSSVRPADNGIACMVVDQTVLGVNGGYGPMPGHAIRVYQKDAEQAQTIVDDILQNR